jgi:hypothetical protein
MSLACPSLKNDVDVVPNQHILDVIRYGMMHASKVE